MKKRGVLNEGISRVISCLGHKDMLVICDAGFPIPKGVDRIDVAVGKNIPRFLETVRVIVEELFVEKIIVANELGKDSELYKKLIGLFSQIKVENVPHEELKAMIRDARAVVRTGEFTPYANVILVCGVGY